MVALLRGIDFESGRDYLEIEEFGGASGVVDAVILGVQQVRGRFRNGFVDPTYLNYFENSTMLSGSIVVRPGQSIVGTVIVTGYRVLNLEAEESDTVEVEGDFIMYNMNLPGSGFLGANYPAFQPGAFQEDAFQI